MRRWFWLAVPAVFWSCAPKKSVRPDLADLFAEVCRIEESRHGKARVGIADYGNAAMDRYLAAPGAPEALWARCQASAGVCREALLQLLLTAHPEWTRANWLPVAGSFSEAEKLLVLTQLALRDDQAFDRQILDYLERDPSATVRAQAAATLARLDLSDRVDDLRRVLDQESEPDVLAALIYSLNAQPSAEVLGLLDGLYDHPSDRVHRATLVCWSTSDLEDKKERIARYLDHPSQAIRVYAKALLNSMGDRDKLEATAEIKPVTQTVEKDVDEALQISLGEAILRQAAGEVEGYLSVGADPNHPVGKGPGDSPLHLAVSWEPSYEVAKLLLEHGADVNRKNRLGRTPLMNAALAMTGHNEILPLLAARGADLEARDNTEETALILAARHGRTAVVRTLLELGADRDARNVHGHTALSLAELLGYEEVADLLIR